MDDPIFDPWCLGDESRPTPSQRTSRWRSASGSTSQGVPSSRPVPSPIAPSPIAPISDDADEEPDRPGRAEPDAAAAFLRALLTPRIETLERRLIMARHRTTVDDRLGRDPATLRFRIEPWQGPFDESEGGRGAVLEITLEGARTIRVAGRLWLDPLSKSPTGQTSVAAEELTSTWIDRLLLDFVEKALKQV